MAPADARTAEIFNKTLMQLQENLTICEAYAADTTALNINLQARVIQAESDSKQLIPSHHSEIDQLRKQLTLVNQQMDALRKEKN